MEQRSNTNKGVFIQPNGSMIVQRGGIMTPIAGAKVTCVEDIEVLPWTKDQIADALLFRMCDEYVRLESTDWETKKKAIYAMIFHSFGHIGIVDDDFVRDTLCSMPYDEDDNNNSVVKLWRLGDVYSSLPKDYERDANAEDWLQAKKNQQRTIK